MRAAWFAILIGCSATVSHPAFPPAPRGKLVDDPYRWLEDMASPQTQAWVAAENKLTTAALADVPGKDALHRRLGELLSHDVSFVPVHRGDRYFWTRREANADQPTIQVAASSDGTAKTLLDPSEFARDGSLQLAGWIPSQDGALIAYGLSSGGGDWTRWRVRDVATGKDLPDELANIKYYSPAFTADHTGIYYSRFPEPAKGKELTEPDHDCKLYLHELGTPVTDDRVVYERPDQPTWQFEPHVTLDGKYLVIEIGDGEVGDSSLEQVAVQDLGAPGAAIVPLVPAYTAEYVFVGNVGSQLYFETNDHAPNKKITAIDVATPGTWRDIVPEGKRAIASAELVGGELVVVELRDAHSALTAYDPNGAKLHDIALPGLGAVYALTGGPGDRDAFYYYTSFTTRGATYDLDLATGKSTPWRRMPPGLDESAFETQQVFFESVDGTKVPMFITAKRGIVLDGTHSTIMTGYGFGGVSLTPAFDPEVIAWLESGGVAVTVNVRGGGEYGDAWHHAAWREHEQVKIDDFVAAAEWLIAHHWTSAAHLGAYGASGGGLLVGAVVVQRPDLFGAVAPIAGVLDLLRFHLFGQGAGWQADLGHPDVPAEAAYLRKISPLHNVRAGTYYPAMFVVTSDHDVRVAPLHSYKFGAALQAAQAGPAPILMRVETESGHGGGGLKSQELEQDTELIAFFAKYLGLELYPAPHGSRD